MVRKGIGDYKILFIDINSIPTNSGSTIIPRFYFLDAIKKLNPDYIFIVSNLEVGTEELSFIYKNRYVIDYIEKYCNVKADYNYCSTDDKYRKPNIGMLDTFINDKDKEYSLMICNKNSQSYDSDKKTAENFGIDYIDIDDFVNMNIQE